MRVLRLLPLSFLFIAPVLAQNAPMAQGDPQALALVQAALTAMGGATAISQGQSWSIQAQTEGSIATGAANESLAWSMPTPGNATTPKISDWRTPRSLLIPEMLAFLLLKESQDPHYVISYAGQTTLAPQAVSIVVFFLQTSKGLRIPAQIYYFPSTSALPVRIEIRLPFRIGDVESFRGVIDLSDYRSVAGISYPFRIATYLPGRPPEIVSLQNVSASAAVPSNSASGGAQ